jgi:small subunit ribosomal protein S9
LPDAAQVIVATGKRKTAIARVRARLGAGNVLINGRTLEDYFPREVLRMRLQQVFEAAGVEGRYDIAARVHGGGIAGQADAVCHGIARALEKADPALRPPLKRKGFLTRDARKKERKKYGQRGARARFQFSKR